MTLGDGEEVSTSPGWGWGWAAYPSCSQSTGYPSIPRSLSGGWEALSRDGQGLTCGRFGDHPLPAAPYPGTYKNNLGPPLQALPAIVGGRPEECRWCSSLKGCLRYFQTFPLTRRGFLNFYFHPQKRSNAFFKHSFA